MSTKESYPCVRTYRGAYQATWGNQIQTVCHIDASYNRLKFPEVKEPGVTNGYLKKLKAFCDVPNLPYVEPPPIGVEASRSEAYAIQKQIEWHSPGFGIVLWVSKLANPRTDPELGDWNCVGYHSVINTGVWRQYDSYPIFSNNLADELEEGDRIGVSLESRWVNGIEYFARVTAPYAMPDNRPDRITFEVGWVQDLIIAKKDPQPIIMYVTNYASGTTQPPVVQKQPVVTLNIGTNPITNPLYNFEKTAFTVEISDLTPGVDYTYQWMFLGNLIGQATTARSDSQGKASISYNSEQFKTAPFQGTGTYALKTVQGNLATDSNSISVKCYSAALYTSFINVGGGAWIADLFDYKDNKPVRITMMKNGVDLTEWFVDVTPSYFSGSTPPRWQAVNLPTSMFTNYASWGISTSPIYQFKAVCNGVTTISPAFAAYTPSSGKS